MKNHPTCKSTAKRLAVQKPDKPIVHYHSPIMITLGVGACVMPIDHKDSANVSNRSYVMTSPVLSIAKDRKSFETRNTRYVHVIQPVTVTH